jgi:MYXO-CTERM domain-containing protein
MVAAVTALLAFNGAAQAVLTDRGNGTVYDSTNHITWLKDWAVNGQKNWATQTAWAAGLDYAGHNDWALPGITQYAELFHEFGDLRSASLPFTNVMNELYWSSTEYSPGFETWSFSPGDNAQYHFVKPFTVMYTVAVHAGDLAPVPAPPAAAMLLLGLGAGVLVQRRRPRPALALSESRSA